MAKSGNPAWIKGVSGNPAGRVPGNQYWIDRVRYLIDKYNSCEIAAIVKDADKFGKLSVFDGMIIRRLAEGISDNGRQSMESLLDRILGKPAQYIETKNDTTVHHHPVSYTAGWLEDSLGTKQAEPPQKPLLN